MPFEKPAKQTVVDLINKTLIKQFDYRNVVINLTAGTFPPNQAFTLDGLHLPGNPPDNLYVPTGITVLIGGYKNSIYCNYQRLRLSAYKPDAFVVGDLQLTDAEFFDQLAERYQIRLTTDDVDILRFQEPVHINNTGFYYRWKVKPKASHLVWVGDWMVRVLPTDHPDATVSQDNLGTVNPVTAGNAEQFISEPFLGDVDPMA